MDERLPSSFMGYLLGRSSSPFSKGLWLSVNVGLRVLQLLERPMDTCQT
jgi:hypothetical protein